MSTFPSEPRHPPPPRRRNKRKEPPRRRPAQVELDSGWTLVTSSPYRMRSEGASQGRAAAGKEGQDKTREAGREGSADGVAAETDEPAPPMRGLTLEKLNEEFERLRGKWREGSGKEVVRRVRAGLEKEEEEEEVEGVGKKRWVDKAVGLAMGSFSSERGDRMRCLWQLVAFVELGTALSSNPSRPIPLYAQDPRFNTLDISFLESLSISPANHTSQSPDSSFISTGTFLYVPFLSWEILLPSFLSHSSPLLYIGNDIDATISQIEFARDSVVDADTKKRYLGIAEGFLKERSRENGVLGDLRDLHGGAFEGLVAYVKNSESVEKEGEGNVDDVREKEADTRKQPAADPDPDLASLSVALEKDRDAGADRQ